MAKLKTFQNLYINIKFNNNSYIKMVMHSRNIKVFGGWKVSVDLGGGVGLFIVDMCFMDEFFMLFIFFYFLLFESIMMEVSH